MWPSLAGTEGQRNPPFLRGNAAQKPTSFSTEHSGSSGVTPANVMSQPSGTQMPDIYDSFSSFPDYASTQNIPGNMQPEFDAMSIPYMDSLLHTDPSWSSHPEGPQENLQGLQQSQAGHLDQNVPASLWQEDFSAAHEIAALMNTYPLNLAQPFDYSAAENP